LLFPTLVLFMHFSIVVVLSLELHVFLVFEQIFLAAVFIDVINFSLS